MVSYEVLKIPRHYIGDGCAQVRLNYKKGLILFNSNQVLFLDNLKVDEKPINAYIADDRRLAFPYFNIPTYKEEHISFIQYHTHQLFDFNRPYISFVDGEFKLNYVLKDEDGTALLVRQSLRFPKGYMFSTKEELPSKIKENLKTKEEPWLIIDGAFMQAHSNFAISLDKMLDDLGKYCLSYADELPLYFETGQIEHNQENLEIESVISRVIGPIFFVRTDGDTIFIKKFQLRRTNEKYYDFEFSDIEGIKMLSLEEIKENNHKINTMPEPNVNVGSNPEYREEDIEEAKNFVKKLKQP